jgi:hypothetical protein
MPEDGHMRLKHIVEEYTQDKYKNKNVAFRAVITLIYRRLMVMQQDAEIQHYEITCYLKVFHGLSQSLQAIARIVSQIRPRSFPSTTFPIH